MTPPYPVTFRRTDNGKKVWIGHTPKGESSPEFPRKRDALDWVYDHSCAAFVEGPFFGDLCGTCGGHVTLHGD